MSTLREHIEALPGVCHSRSGLMCDDTPCSTTIDRDSVLWHIPEGSVLLTAESLALAVALAEIKYEDQPDKPSVVVRRWAAEYAADIIARLREPR